MPATAELEIVRPDDWHLHLRDGAMLEAVLPCSSAFFGRAIIMPNLVPPVRTAEDAIEYRERIRTALPADHNFEPLMTCYLTDDTDPADLRAGYENGVFTAAKLYPAGATTNSENGVTDIARIDRVLAAMEETGMSLLLHGEVVDAEVDVFDREKVFIDSVLDPMRRRFSGLRTVLEHTTSAEGVDYVRESGDNIAATITVHHLIINRNAMFAGGIRPHYYCLPVAKREHHRLALRQAAISGNPSFFLGTDSAPHVDATKETACGCAGVFTAPNALSCLVHVFEEEEALDRLEGFASLHGPRFYGLPPNDSRIRLVKQEAGESLAQSPGQSPAQSPGGIDTPEGPVTVFDPGFPLRWQVV